MARAPGFGIGVWDNIYIYKARYSTTWARGVGGPVLIVRNHWFPLSLSHKTPTALAPSTFPPIHLSLPYTKLILTDFPLPPLFPPRALSSPFVLYPLLRAPQPPIPSLSHQSTACKAEDVTDAGNIKLSRKHFRCIASGVWQSDSLLRRGAFCIVLRSSGVRAL